MRQQRMSEENNTPKTSPTVSDVESNDILEKKRHSILDRVLKILPFHSPKTSLEKSVVDLIEEHDAEGEKIGSEERVMLSNLFSFGELTVEDVMIPRGDIIAIEEGISLDELRDVIAEKEHTRMPVYRNSLDDVVGFLHIKGLIPFIGKRKDFVLEDMVREILFVPPSMKIIDLLKKMRLSRVHIALVVDEYGGTDGLVTIEDLVEEIVGEIKDEYDDQEEGQDDFVVLDDGAVETSPRMTIEQLEEVFSVTISVDKEDEDFETLGGLIYALTERVPETDEVISHHSGLQFKVLDADERSVKRIHISKTLTSEA